MLKNMYASVMDENVNPLRTLPKIVRFQLMITLATLWSGVFAIWSGMMICGVRDAFSSFFCAKYLYKDTTFYLCI